MAALINKTDIQNELQVTLAAGYTDAIMTEICNWAHSRLRRATSRITFTGDAANEAKYAEVCFAIDRMATSNRDLMKAAISSISENGATIQFNNGKTLESYRKEAEQIIKDLALPGTKPYTFTWADPGDVHTGDESSALY